MTAAPWPSDILVSTGRTSADRTGSARVIALHAGTEQERTSPATAWVQQPLPLQWGIRPTADQAPAGRLDPTADDPQPRIQHALWLIGEILAGIRPAEHLSRWATRRVCDQLIRRTLRESATGPAAGHVTSDRPAQRTSLGVARWMVVGERTIEAFCTARVNGQFRAIAVRVQYRHRRWLITELDLP